MTRYLESGLGAHRRRSYVRPSDVLDPEDVVEPSDPELVTGPSDVVEPSDADPDDDDALDLI